MHEKSPIRGDRAGNSRLQAEFNSLPQKLQAQRRKITFEEVNARALSVVPLILARVLPGGKMQQREYVVLNPRRADTLPGSFKVNVSTGKWADFAVDVRGGDPVSLIAYLENIKQTEALKIVAQMVGIS